MDKSTTEQIFSDFHSDFPSNTEYGNCRELTEQPDKKVIIRTWTLTDFFLKYFLRTQCTASWAVLEKENKRSFFGDPITNYRFAKSPEAD